MHEQTECENRMRIWMRAIGGAGLVEPLCRGCQWLRLLRIAQRRDGQLRSECLSGFWFPAQVVRVFVAFLLDAAPTHGS